MTDTAQLALFLSGVAPTFDIMEEFFPLIPMKDTITEAEVFESVRKWTTETNLNLSKLTEVTTDGAPAIIGEKKFFLPCSKNTLVMSNSCTDFIGLSIKTNCVQSR